MTGTATAMLTELIPAPARQRAPLVATAAKMGGPGLGPLFAGLFAQYAPHPTTLVFEAYLALLAAAAVIFLLVPETVRPRTRLTLRFVGLGIPERGRGEFIAAAVAAFVVFALLGLFSSLGTGVHRRRAPSGPPRRPGSRRVPSARRRDCHSGHAVAVQQPPGRAGGLGRSLAALALIIVALAQAGMTLFLAGTVTGGVAVGAIFLGSLATASRLAPADRRGQAISALFVACYAGLIIPVIGVGVLSEFTGTFPAVLTFTVLLAVLCLCSMARIASPRAASSGRPPG